MNMNVVKYKNKYEIYTEEEIEFEEYEKEDDEEKIWKKFVEKESQNIYERDNIIIFEDYSEVDIYSE